MRKIAYCLRHNPFRCHLNMDKKGYVPINELLCFLNGTNKWLETIDINDIRKTIEISDKKRFELKDDKIRAYYGHSICPTIVKIVSKPPEKLYHGTSHKAADLILSSELNSQKRQYVHLSTNIDAAKKIGSRRDKHPVILEIDAQSAYKDGVKFYLGNEDVWLSDSIPSKYIKKLT